MRDTVLLFESRDLCYESNRYFMACMEDAFEEAGYKTELCSLSVHMEEKLMDILERQENYLAAFDFNSLLPRLELEDGTPYLEAFQVPFFNYLADHPLYHHAGVKREFPNYAVICIDTCHLNYIKQYYPHIKNVYYLPLGAMRAPIERRFGQKRLELLFLGTYEPERKLYQELLDYPSDKRREISALIERMEADHELTQEAALAGYLREENVEPGREEFAARLNQSYLADKYIRNLKRRNEAVAAAKAGVPFTVIGHGWEFLEELKQKHVRIQDGVGFAASLQMTADAKLLLNTTPCFHGGFHDRVYSAMINRTVCLTEGSLFAQKNLADGREAALFDSRRLNTLTESIVRLYGDPAKMQEITECAYQRASTKETWQKRVEKIMKEAGEHFLVF